jgi:hypothetical protein
VCKPELLRSQADLGAVPGRAKAASGVDTPGSVSIGFQI